MVTTLDFTSTAVSRDMLRLVYDLAASPRAQFTTLVFSKSFLASSVGDLMAALVIDCPSLTSLDLSENPLGERDDLTTILAALGNQRNLRTLLLANTRMGDQHCTLLSSLLTSDPATSEAKTDGEAAGLKKLSLARNPVSLPAFAPLSSLFAHWCFRENLQGITATGGAKLLGVLRTNRTITEVNVEGVPLPQDQVTAILDITMANNERP